MGTLDDKIASLSKGDDAYAMKLKQHFKDALGYSNYMSRIGQETAKPASIGDIKGLSPAGINARIGTRFGMQDDRINSLNRMSGAIDTAAGGLAADQISREKSAATNGPDISFDPKSQMEREIDNYIHNPKNPDGSTKSLQQFEAEMNEKFAAVQGADGQPVDANKPYDMGNGEIQSQDILDSNKIKEAIQSKIPKDYIGKEVYYQALLGGAKDDQAQKLQTFDDYKTGRMSKSRKATYELMNPTVKQDAEVAREEETVSAMASERVEDENGDTAPKYSIEEIIKANPTMTEAKVKAAYQQSLQTDVADDVKKLFSEKQLSAIDKSITDNDFASVKETDEYKKVLGDLSDAYADYYTKAEIENLVYKVLHGKI